MMTADEYRDLLERAGLTQNAAAKLLGVAPESSRKWAREGGPEPVRRFLLLLIGFQIAPKAALAALAKADPASASIYR